MTPWAHATLMENRKIIWIFSIDFQGALAVQEALEVNPRANIIACLRCRQRNLRTHHNNHIRCWQCHANVCYQCRQLIQGKVTAHYAANMPCQQHNWQRVILCWNEPLVLAVTTQSCHYLTVRRISLQSHIVKVSGGSITTTFREDKSSWEWCRRLQEKIITQRS